MPAPGAPDWFFFDARERDIVAAALDVVAAGSPEQGEQLLADLDRLAHAAEVVRKSPSIQRSWSAARRARGAGEALVEALCKVPDYDLDLHIPTKAVLGQAYLVAKINFFKALGYSLELAPGADDLRERLAFELGQSIYTKLGEELFVSIVTDAGGARDVKLSAARSLFRIWEDRLLAEIDDFAPVLEAAWEARDKVRPVLGAMRGAHEIFALLREAKDGRFLDYFGGDDVPEEQLMALEEFLFGLSHEEIERLRRHLSEQHAAVVSPEEARGVLGRRPESWGPADGGPQALYTSYKRRRVKAHYRALTGAAGPKKTAEEYVMIEFLRRGVAG
jgi:hypothetical protein